MTRLGAASTGLLLVTSAVLGPADGSGLGRAGSTCSACECTRPLEEAPLEEAVRASYEEAAAVFAGVVVAQNQWRPSAPDGDGPLLAEPMYPGDPHSPYLFRVTASFKGPNVRLFGAFNDDQCGLSGLEVGAHFLVYARGGRGRDGVETYFLSMCSRSRPIGEAREEVTILRRLAE